MRTLAWIPLLLGTACASTPEPMPVPVRVSVPAAVAVATPKDRPPLAFIEDDFAKAKAKAKAEGKVLFVDAWAPWCHTCLSMQRFVLGDPALRPLADRVVFAALDTDKPESASFLEKHAMRFWPTFFVLDPATDKVLGTWAGSASVAEMRTFVEEAAAEAGPGSGDAGAKLLAEARRKAAAGDFAGAAKAYEGVATASPRGSPRFSVAVVGWIEALAGAGDVTACGRAGVRYLADVVGAAAPADAAGQVLRCAEKMPKGVEREKAREVATARLRDVIAKPPEGATIDDRADALEMMAEALGDAGDKGGAMKVHEERLVLLERAAAAATSPEVASTFDYARATSYVAVGRPEQAVRLLEARRKELPNAYDPPARLAGVLFKVGRNAEALASVKRAVALSYGPRKLRYMALQADIEAAMGDNDAAVKTLRAEVAAHEALAPGQANAGRLGDARKRLERAVAKSGARP